MLFCCGPYCLEGTTSPAVRSYICQESILLVSAEVQTELAEGTSRHEVAGVTQLQRRVRVEFHANTDLQTTKDVCFHVPRRKVITLNLDKYRSMEVVFCLDLPKHHLPCWPLPVPGRFSPSVPGYPRSDPHLSWPPPPPVGPACPARQLRRGPVSSPHQLGKKKCLFD